MESQLELNLRIFLMTGSVHPVVWVRNFSIQWLKEVYYDKLEMFEALVDNLTADLLSIDKTIRQRVVENLTNADPELGRLVADGLKL